MREDSERYRDSFVFVSLLWNVYEGGRFEGWVGVDIGLWDGRKTYSTYLSVTRVDSD